MAVRIMQRGSRLQNTRPSPNPTSPLATAAIPPIFAAAPYTIGATAKLLQQRDLLYHHGHRTASTSAVAQLIHIHLPQRNPTATSTPSRITTIASRTTSTPSQQLRHQNCLSQQNILHNLGPHTPYNQSPDDRLTHRG